MQLCVSEHRATLHFNWSWRWFCLSDDNSQIFQNFKSILRKLHVSEQCRSLGRILIFPALFSYLTKLIYSNIWGYRELACVGAVSFSAVGSGLDLTEDFVYSKRLLKAHQGLRLRRSLLTLSFLASVYEYSLAYLFHCNVLNSDIVCSQCRCLSFVFAN